jgi:sortase A
LRQLQRLLFIVGGVMLALYGAALIHRTVFSKAEPHRSNALQPLPTEAPRAVSMTTAAPDLSQWSEKRVKEYQESLAEHFPPALGILRVPKLNVEVPILEGTDDLSLNRAVGHVTGTATPGQDGNMAIAGHRDGFFRGLKDVVLGDTLELVTPQRRETYVIDRITIVQPRDVSVLQPRSHASLTLITCYPFYFIGSAPQRYIVQASIVESGTKNDVAHAPTLSMPAADDHLVSAK